MGDRAFRFGVVAGGATSQEQWTALAKRAEDAGYETLLVPDATGAAAPFPALAMAAGATTELRLGTFVLAAPLRTPGSIAWETATIDRLSGGRFELGLGAGRPGAEADAKLLGVPFGTAGQRVAALAETITSVRAIFRDATQDLPGGMGPNFLCPVQRPGPPLMVAGAGPKLLRLAATQADIIGIGTGGSAGETELGEKVEIVRAAAGDRFDEIELSVNIFAAGDADLPGWMVNFFGADPAEVKDNRSVAVLTGGVDEMADVLLRRRDRYGISYVTVNQFAMEPFTPVLERLRGR